MSDKLNPTTEAVIFLANFMLWFSIAPDKTSDEIKLDSLLSKTLFSLIAGMLTYALTLALREEYRRGQLRHNSTQDIFLKSDNAYVKALKDYKETIPEEFKDPSTQKIMDNPVTIYTKYGKCNHHLNMSTIESFRENYRPLRDPMTKKRIRNHHPNEELRLKIQQFVEEIRHKAKSTHLLSSQSFLTRRPATNITTNGNENTVKHPLRKSI